MSNSPTSIRDAQNRTPVPRSGLLANPQLLETSPFPTKILPASKHKVKLDPFRPPYPDMTDLSVRSGAPSSLSLHLPWLWGFPIQSLAGPCQLQTGPSGSGPAAPSQKRLPVGGDGKKQASSGPAGQQPGPWPSEPKTHLQVSREHVLQFVLLAPSPLLLLLLIPISQALVHRALGRQVGRQH